MISMHLDPSLAIATASDLCHIELESRSRDVPAAGRSGEAIWAASHQRPGAQSIMVFNRMHPWLAYCLNGM